VGARRTGHALGLGETRRRCLAGFEFRSACLGRSGRLQGLGGSMEESSTVYAVVADAHDDVLRDVIKDSR
jgi:hypothetical protein